MRSLFRRISVDTAVQDIDCQTTEGRLQGSAGNVSAHDAKKKHASQTQVSEQSLPLVEDVVSLQTQLAEVQAALKKSQQEYKQTVQDLQKKIQRAQEQLLKKDGLLESFRLARQQLIDTLKPDIVRLSLLMAKKILAKEVQQNDYLVQLIGQLVEYINDQQELVVKLHPQDIESLTDNGFDLQAIFDSADKVDIVASPEILPGGCLIETKTGIIDGRLERRIAELEQELGFPSSDLLEQGVSVTAPRDQKEEDASP